MEDITTKNNIITDLEQYIKKGPFLNPKTKEQKFWLHNLPENEELFNIIELLRNKYNYETFIITQNINITNQNINKEINLSNCIFENAFIVKKSFFSCINFKNSIFKENVSFKEIIFDKNIHHLLFSFDSVKFEGYKTEFVNSELHNISFAESIFNSEITSFQFSKIYDGIFYKTEFRENVLFDSFGNNPKTEIQNTSFKRVIFNKQANFQQVLFFNNILFENTLFKGDTFFLKAKFYQINNKYKNKLQENNDIKERSEVNFKKSNFIGNIYFSEAFFETDVDFSGSQFNTISFGNAIFDRNVRFYKTTFNNNIDFFNTSFNKLVEFYRVHFYKPIQFHFTDFLDRAIFSSSEFDEEVQFLHCRVDSNSYIRFESATFKKSLDISRSNFNDKANFWNIELEEGDAFTSSKYKNDFNEKAKTESTKNSPTIYKKIRETYRIIKSNFYSQNNKIEGLKFYEKEMSVYLEEKRAEDKNTKQSKKKNKLLTSNSKPNIITNSNKINFNNIKKKYLNTYNSLDLLFAIGLSFLIVCFSVIYPLFWFLRKAIHLFAEKVSYKDLKNGMKKIINNKNFYLYIRIFIRICFNRLIALKNNNFFLFIVTFLTIIFILGIMYIVQHKYIWYWFFVFLIILLFYIISYQNRKIIKSNIKSNNYISLVLLSIPSIIILVIFYGINNYKNDWIYRLLNYLSIQFSIIVKDEQIFSFILTIISIITAIVLAIISNKQDKLLLWFNKNSNIFGTDWVVGINFTILVTLVAYSIILYSSPNLLFLPNLEGVGNFLKGLVDILNLTDWNDITILGEKLTTWQYIFLFIGRIFVAYGVYQTVQAFRKFGKS